MIGFKSIHVIGRNLDETWSALLRELYHHGRRYKIDAGSFAGAERLEFDFVSGTILEPVQYTAGGVRLPLAARCHLSLAHHRPAVPRGRSGFGRQARHWHAMESFMNVPENRALAA